MQRREMLSLLPSLALAGIAPVSARESRLPKNRRRSAPEHGPLALQYLTRVQGMLHRIMDTQAEPLTEGAHAIARTVRQGGTCWCSWDMGHNTAFDLFPDREGDPGIFTMGYDQSQTKDGDLFLASIWGGPHADLAAKDIFVIGAPAPWGSDAKRADLIVREGAKVRLKPYADLWIETGVSTLGAIMKLPGSPAPIGPVSGILGMTTFWMLTADACRLLARDGVTLTVRGTSDAASASFIPDLPLDAPIMHYYHEKVIRQIEMVAGEFGSIREAARMACDSVLSGGHVYCYSRERNSLSAEGQTRRGGLALTRGIHFDGDTLTGHGIPFDGKDGDTVFMGIAEPDNQYDLRALDTFRARGMKVVAMGPMTRNIAIPEGRTVPKDADLHIGRMIDTLGLFALPGWNRNICPTSGAIQNQIFWATCIELAEEIIRRTGNTPGVFFSAAIRGGTEHMHRVRLIADERGY